MPNYDFQCRDCGIEYEHLARYDETGVYSGVVCPECGSENKDKLMSSFSFTFTDKAAGGTKLFAASHDRRFFHKLEKDRKDREEAERKSHMGSAPYNPIDDISSGEYFGPAK